MNPNASESLIHGHCPACGTIQPVRGTLVEPHAQYQWESSELCPGSGRKPASYIVSPEVLSPIPVPGGGRRF